MSETNPNWDAVEALLQAFYPQYFDPNSPHYVDPIVMQQLDMLAQEARPWCLNNGMQNIAEAWFLAYLISLRYETSSGQSIIKPSGPVTSEKEGDVAVTYADLTAQTKLSKRPPSDPYDAWQALWARCGKGAITTRYGDPYRRYVAPDQAAAMLTPGARLIWNG